MDILINVSNMKFYENPSCGAKLIHGYRRTDEETWGSLEALFATIFERAQQVTSYSRTSGLIRTASHPDMQKIRIIGFFLEIMLHWQFLSETNSTNGCLELHIYLHTNKTLFRWCPSTFTADEDFGNSLSDLGIPSALGIYGMYLRVNLSTTPGSKF